MTIWRICLGGLCGVAALAKPAAGASAVEITAGVPVVKFPVPRNVASWEKRREQVRKTLWQLLGDLPPRPKRPGVRVIERKRHSEGFTVEKFEFDNGAGASVPGYICIPKGLKGRAPAILFCHQHGGMYDVGKEAIFQPWPIDTPSAVEFTRRGYVLLAIDAYCFGERNGKGVSGEKGGRGELTESKLNLWLGRSLWGMMVRDDLMALDYLCSRPEVDRRRIGVTGMSMGSTRSWWLAGLDDRPAATVCVCCLTRYQDLIAAGQLRAHGIYYFVPGMLRHFDTEAVVSLIAPRPLLTLTGDKDGGSPIAGVEKINAFAQKVYDMYGKSECFRGVVYPGVGHEYTREMWTETLDWFDRWLKPKR